MRGLNRAEVCDVNFLEAVRGGARRVARARGRCSDPARQYAHTAAAFDELFDSQLASRQLDLMARVLRAEQGLLHHRVVRP